MWIPYASVHKIITCTFWQPSFFYDSWIIYNFVAIVLNKIAILAFTYLYTLSRCSANDEMLMFYFHQNRCVVVNWDVFKLYANVWMSHNINAMYCRYDSCKNSYDWLAICWGGHFHDQSFFSCKTRASAHGLEHNQLPPPALIPITELLFLSFPLRVCFAW